MFRVFPRTGRYRRGFGLRFSQSVGIGTRELGHSAHSRSGDSRQCVGLLQSRAMASDSAGVDWPDISIDRGHNDE